MTDDTRNSGHCGSGRPPLERCGRRAVGMARVKLIAVWAGILLVTGVVTAVTLSLESNKPKPAINPVTVGSSSATPAPWEYNPITNQHWDPRAGHEHWHAGPPPNDPLATLQDTSARTPQPYEYDAINDRHWDPQHGHWHSGSPPTDR